jgi:mannitol-specific phosphotransferase system IIBC component
MRFCGGGSRPSASTWAGRTGTGGTIIGTVVCTSTTVVGVIVASDVVVVVVVVVFFFSTVLLCWGSMEGEKQEQTTTTQVNAAKQNNPDLAEPGMQQDQYQHLQHTDSQHRQTASQGLQLACQTTSCQLLIEIKIRMLNVECLIVS